MKQKFNVEGMTCSACSAHVDKAVSNIDGVNSVNVNLLSNFMEVAFDEEKVTINDITDAVKQAGYFAYIKKNNDKQKKKDDVVKLEFFDPDWDENVDGRSGVVEVYYLKNPDEAKLAELKNMVEHRFDAMYREGATDEELDAAQQFVDSVWTRIDDFIREHFDVVDVDRSYRIIY